ncbi:MAG TPA: hypothetical protein VK932_05790 [Kofleriaceae bacterium]|nr:hypothetical protein [Kofleriaceae bacterium]
MLFPSPPAPAFPPDQAHTAEAQLRYEDLAQDGRVIPLALPTSMSGLWQHVLRQHPGQRHCVAQGILPILTRLTLTSLEAPIRVDRPIESTAGFLLAHDRDAAGQPRLYLNIWSELRGAGGRVGPRPPGPPVLAGRLFAEHTFTRPFAPPDRRRVTRLDVEGFPELPEARYDAPAPATAGEAPAGARWLDELAPDPAGVAFSLDQTDSNQHVNSLVYIRVFLDAVQRRLAAGGHPLTVLSRAVDIAYRKPCFAGDRVRAHVRLFELDGTIGAAGFIAGPGEEARPRCYVRAVYG